MSDQHADHAHTHHITSLKTLFATFFALVILTILTVVQARVPEVKEIIGSAEIFVTLLIATIKASLVAFIFMQLAHDKPFNQVVIFSSLLFVALFLGFTLVDSHQYRPDVREYRYDHVREETAPAAAAPAAPAPAPAAGATP
jgi:cytochrome c oxidase subunit 4